VTCNGRLLVSLVFIAIGCSVSGCGGGGGGGASPSTPQPPGIPADPGDDPPTVTYTGNTSPATLTQAPTSSGRMADRIVDAVVATQSLGVYLARTVRGDVCALPIGRGLAADGTGWIAATLRDCDPGNGTKWSGKAILRIKNSSGLETSLTFPALTLVGAGGRSTTMAGSVQIQDAATLKLTSNFALQDSSGGSARVESFVLEFPVRSSPQPARVSGHIYDSNVGYAEISTNGEFQVTQENTYLRSGGGSIRARGASSSVWISPLTPRLTALELDTAGLDTASKSVLLVSNASFETQLANPAPGQFGAAAGPEQTLSLGQQYRLNGRFTGADSHVWFDFSWRLAVTPPGSNAELLDAHSPTPGLVPDAPGAYSVELASSDGSNVTLDLVSLSVPYAEDTHVPPPSLVSVGPYLGPDIAAPATHSLSATTAFSTFEPTPNAVRYDYMLLDPRGTRVEQVQVSPDQTLPTTGLSITGFHEQSLFNALEGRGTRRFAAHELPLRYHRPVGFRALGVGRGIAVGDLSGDGRPDIVATGYRLVPGGNVKTVGVYRNVSPGRYAAPQYVGAGNGGAVVLGDFNGDTRLDIAAEAAYTGIDLIFAQADGSWSSPQRLAPARPQCGVDVDTFAHPLVTADFNGDGRSDLAVIYSCSPAAIVVFTQNGDGSFTEQDISPTREPRTLLTADVTNDGLADLIGVFTSPFTNAPAYVEVYPSTGASFGAAISYDIPEPPTGGTVAGGTGDYDGDGRTDLVVATLNGYYWFRQVGAGFAAATKLAPFDKPLWASNAEGAPTFQVSELRIQDIDDDGRPDVVALSNIMNSILFLTHKADGTLGPADSAFALGNGRDQYTLPWFFDENGDGRTDMVYRGAVVPDAGQPGVALVLSRR